MALLPPFNDKFIGKDDTFVMKISILKEDKNETLDQIHRMNGYWSNNEKYGHKVFLICLQVALIAH